MIEDIHCVNSGLEREEEERERERMDREWEGGREGGRKRGREREGKRERERERELEEKHAKDHLTYLSSLFVSKYQIDPVMQVRRYILTFQSLVQCR